MSPSPAPPRELPNTYVMQDRSQQDELLRLHIQDQMLTQTMDGVLPEQEEPARFQCVLDVGCGTGGWLLETARTLPGSTLLIGVDANPRFIEFARKQAQAAGVSDRVKFQVMDALLRLEFPDQFFDLVNLRLGLSWLRTWDWRKVLSEFQRVCRQEGVIRMVESRDDVESNSAALTAIFALFRLALYRSGHLFSAEPGNFLKELPGLLTRHGVQEVKTRTFRLEYQAGEPSGEQYRQDLQLLCRTAKPFLNKWVKLPNDYDQLCQQALCDMQQLDFDTASHMLAVWGHPGPALAEPPQFR